MTIDTVLFDVGNVLVPDYWESLWLTKDMGLADRLGVPIGTAAAIGSRLWTRYDRAFRVEADYWSEFSIEASVYIPSELVAEVEAELIVANPHARNILEELSAKRVRIGIISNNTSFFAPKQLSSLGCEHLFDRSLIFLSCEKGVAKGDASPDLFIVAASETDPATTLVIDDRPHNIECARRAGFTTYFYPATAWASAGDDYYRPGPYDAFRLSEIISGL